MFNVGRVLLSNKPLIQTRRGGGGYATSVECLFPITPSYKRAEEEEDIRRRWSACSQYELPHVLTDRAAGRTPHAAFVTNFVPRGYVIYRA